MNHPLPNCRHLLLSALLAYACLPAPAADETGAAPVNRSSYSRPLSRPVPDGIYLILQETEDKRDLKTSSQGERILANDYRFLDPAERGKPTYVVVSTASFIPMTLSGDPKKEKDGRGRSKLMLELAQNRIGPLEKFTQTNLGRSIAIVIGDQVVTTHKIKEAITGGRMQITRCTDSGCDVLYSQLKRSDR